MEESFMKASRSDRNFVAIAWVVLGVVARLLPHPANVTPMTAISLFGGAQLGRKAAFALTLLILVLSDLLLAAIQGHQAFGPWTFFTYTGFAAVVWAGGLLHRRPGALRSFGLLLGSSLGFWLWTNFGTWATGAFGLYPRTLEGLLACYTAGLPFLRNAMLGDLVWGTAFFLGFAGVRQVAPRFFSALHPSGR